ncbi:hypothetical protein D3C77_394710 [compost metagenome]
MYGDCTVIYKHHISYSLKKRVQLYAVVIKHVIFNRHHVIDTHWSWRHLKQHTFFFQLVNLSCNSIKNVSDGLHHSITHQPFSSVLRLAPQFG